MERAVKGAVSGEVAGRCMLLKCTIRCMHIRTIRCMHPHQSARIYACMHLHSPIGGACGAACKCRVAAPA